MRTKLDSFEKWILFVMLFLVAMVFFESPGEYILFFLFGFIVYTIDTRFGDGFAFISGVILLVSVFLIDRFVTNIPIFDSFVRFFL